MRYVIEKDDTDKWRAACVEGEEKNESEAFGISGTGDTPVEALTHLIDAIAEDIGITNHRR